MQKIKDIINLIEKSIKTEPNNLITWWNIINDWYNEEVDEYRNLVLNANDWLAKYTQELVEMTGLSNLKIKYTWTTGYFIEVPLSQKSKVPEYFIHKTTLVNALRYTTEELKVFENKIINCESFLCEKEYNIFKDVSNQILESFNEIRDFSSKTANIDYISNLAQISYENNYIKPEITNNYDLKIISGRHPIIEKIVNDFF